MWARYAASVAACCCLLGTARAQAGLEAEAVRLGREGVSLLEAGQAASAVERLNAALEIWLRLENVQSQAVVAGKLGEAERALGRSSDAIVFHLRAANLSRTLREYDFAQRQYELAADVAIASRDPRRTCEIGGGYGEVQLAVGAYGWAVESLKNAVVMCNRLGDSEGEAKAWSALGDLYTRQGRYEEALVALGSARKIGFTNTGLRMSIAKNLGILYSNEARFDDAQFELEQARGLARAAKDLETEGVILAALGRTYYLLGRYSEARTRYEDALTLLDAEIPLNNKVARDLRPLHADAWNGLGDVSLAERNPSLAQEYSTLALRAIYVEPGDQVKLRGDSDRRMSTVEGTARNNLAAALIAQGDSTGALQQLNGVRVIAEDQSDEALRGRALSQSGVVLLGLGQIEEAAKNFQTALDIQTSVGDVIGEIATLERAATLAQQRERYAEALSNLGRAVDLLEDVRGSLEATESRMGFLSARTAAGEAMTSLLASLAGAQSPPPFTLKDAGDDYASAALHYAERARTREWVEVLARTRGSALELPGELGREERTLIASRDAELRSIRELTGDLRRSSERYQNVTSELRRFIGGLRASSDATVRAYAALRYPVPLRAPDIQKSLRPDEVLIEYSIKPSHTVMWILERDRPVRLVPLSLSADEIAEQVRLIRKSFQLEMPIPEDSLERLYRALLVPALERVAPGKRLVIVADGSLSSLPFEALGWQSAEGWRFVADEWLVSYYPSATLLALTRLDERPESERSRRAWSRPLFAMGDPLYGDDGEFGRLAGTREEVTAIGKVLGVITPSSDVRLGADARESAIKQASSTGDLSNYRYVHLAAHALLSTSFARVDEPALVLSQQGEANDDGFLTMGEVLGLRMSADLVVLSACETALGNVVPGEGVVGLMRAFFHAGTQSAVVSLWRVADSSTADLMQHFYQGLAGPTTACVASDKVCALNEARRSLRATHPHPHYWAPFVLFGER